MKTSIMMAAVIYAAASITASAIPVAPGDFLFPPLDEPPPAGAPIAQLITPFAGADVQGTLISSVYAGDILPGFTFTYEILVDFASGHSVSQLSVGNYGPFFTDMSYSSAPNPAGVAPTYADRSLDGDVLHYNFSMLGGTGIWGGQSSALLVVRTDAMFYEPTVASVINSGAAEMQSFAPIAVPEPASMAMIGLVATGLYFKRRFFIA